MEKNNMKKTRSKTLIGKHILVGLTYVNSKGKNKKRIQLHGNITARTGNTLYFQRADGKGEFSVPFTGKLKAGDPKAVYKLKATGELVTNVDFITSFTVYPPDKSMDAESYYDRGNDHAAKGQFDQAISDFTKAIRINPKADSAYKYYLLRGIAYGGKGRYDQAISDLNTVIRIEPHLAHVYNDRGFVYIHKAEYEKAISDYTKAIQMKAMNADTYSWRGYAFYCNGQYDQAISDFKKAIKIDSKMAKTYNSFAWLLATAKDASFRNGKKAVRLALKACKLSDWKDPADMDSLAAAYARAGDFTNAVKWQRKVLESAEFSKDKEARDRLNLYRKHKPWPPD